VKFSEVRVKGGVGVGSSDDESKRVGEGVRGVRVLGVGSKS
jgi:hypothetical protein